VRAGPVGFLRRPSYGRTTAYCFTAATAAAAAILVRSSTATLFCSSVSVISTALSITTISAPIVDRSAESGRRTSTLATSPGASVTTSAVAAGAAAIAASHRHQLEVACGNCTDVGEHDSVPRTAVVRRIA
jgi:hypothetical protein